ncbi:class I SAM-dependent RNA methyltransferase [Corynebacterium halotolerans]|uniref:SAM-dependent methyltransferase n=1 Tax=Corynebacterium halotolerans YIM 70093 = DSM 44683 TaxID=1121362 RepID=M1NMQ2_9CORY|nr:TRAM domain-containing protein [Corynebacterium halotolerans]AGF72643.1 SAM-dependent methyltransferase [Corynebacterium halotolerans YIM 70093 = DSM 44683]
MTEIAQGTTLTLTVERMAHGGEGIATHEGRVIFVRGAYPGDTVTVTVSEVKKRFARAGVDTVVEAGEFRAPQACPAAAAGAGCCDYGDVDPAGEAQLKARVLTDQLTRLGGVDELPPTEHLDLVPARGWRTRVRLGVDEQGRAGVRARGSRELVTSVACTQVVPGLLDGLVGEGARTFTPGAEIIVVLDGEGQRHIVETRRAPRGRRVEKITDVLEGSGTVTETADGHTFTFPATAFWQGHVQAPDAYTGLIRRWLEDLPAAEDTGNTANTGWDLYGGVGLFVPALGDSLGAGARIITVDYSPAAAGRPQGSLADYDVQLRNARVEKAVDTLPAPRVVVLDPPRTGAGREVVATVAKAGPERIIHIGCDPATFSRDIASWRESGYRPTRMALINAFPGTHHFEVIAQLER